MQFIDVTEDHYQQIAALLPTAEELYLVYPSATFPLDNKQLQQLAELRTDLTVVIENNKVVAFANLYQLKPQHSAFIGNVVVAKSYRGKGIGKALTKHMMQVCHTKYQATAHLSVFNFNTTALLLYTNLGFKPYAVEARKNLNDETVALIHMKCS